MARTSVLPTVRGSVPQAPGVGELRRGAPVRRTTSGPDVAAFDYGHQAAVSRVPHRDRREVGFGTLCGIALVTAALSLGLVAIANLRAADTAPAAPASVSVVDGVR